MDGSNCSTILLFRYAHWWFSIFREFLIVSRSWSFEFALTENCWAMDSPARNLPLLSKFASFAKFKQMVAIWVVNRFWASRKFQHTASLADHIDLSIGSLDRGNEHYWEADDAEFSVWPAPYVCIVYPVYLKYLFYSRLAFACSYSHTIFHV